MNPKSPVTTVLFLLFVACSLAAVPGACIAEPAASGRLPPLSPTPALRLESSRLETRRPQQLQTTGQPQTAPAESAFPTAALLSATPMVRNVYIIVYDPLLSSGKTLSQQQGWHDHAALTRETVEFFKQASHHTLHYNVVATEIVTDGWPIKADGFRYTEAEYFQVINGQSSPHYPDDVDYNQIVNDARFDLCGQANRGEIDEVWIYNGPYFGFYESTLVGPGAYWLNSPPVPGPHDCTRLLPIMGPSVERGLDCTLENFGHRAEATLTQVYGSWEQNRTTHAWEKFALVKAQSPAYTHSGCGSIHFPPNGVAEYIYDNPNPMLSNCADFARYPDLGDPAVVSQPVSCSAWGCSSEGYFQYWFSHLPANPGCGPDNVANNWWRYFTEPALALDPPAGCQPISVFKSYLPVVRG